MLSHSRSSSEESISVVSSSGEKKTFDYYSSSKDPRAYHIMSGKWCTLRLAIVKSEGAAEMVEAEDTLVMLSQGRAQQVQPKPRPKLIYILHTAAS